MPGSAVLKCEGRPRELHQCCCLDIEYSPSHQIAGEPGATMGVAGGEGGSSRFAAASATLPAAARERDVPLTGRRGKTVGQWPAGTAPGATDSSPWRTV